jgi:cobalt transporter subunit CbtA
MVNRILLTALAAGLLAGVFVFAAHMIKTEPLILHAEVYENAAPEVGHSQDSGSATHEDEAEAEEWAPEDGFERYAYTLVADLLSSFGFAFILVGAIALRGRQVDWRKGMIWGLCGFAAFFVGPSLGLAPEVPGMAAADLMDRQIWWLGTVAATAGGLALVFFSGPIGLKAIGFALMALPHLIGAPGHEIQPGGVPAELAAQFAAATLVISGLFWLVLGALTGHFYQRFSNV